MLSSWWCPREENRTCKKHFRCARPCQVLSLSRVSAHFALSQLCLHHWDRQGEPWAPGVPNIIRFVTRPGCTASDSCSSSSLRGAQVPARGGPVLTGAPSINSVSSSALQLSETHLSHCQWAPPPSSAIQLSNNGQCQGKPVSALGWKLRDPLSHPSEDFHLPGLKSCLLP